MKYTLHLRRSMITVSLVLLIGLCSLTVCYAQGGNETKKAGWANLENWPRFTDGVWIATKTVMPEGNLTLPIAVPPMQNTPSLEVTAKISENKPSCNPLELFAQLINNKHLEIFFSPEKVTLLFDDGTLKQQAFLDNRAHTEAQENCVQQHAARWERQTLLVDTLANQPINEGVSALANNIIHITQHLHLQNSTSLVMDITVDAPASLVTPGKYSVLYEKKTH